VNAPALNFDDPLARCLAVTARLHGQPVSAEALTAGLPLEDGRLTPALASRAAERAGLAARVVKVALDEIKQAALPVILLMQDRGACVLVKRNGDEAHTVLPELPEAVRTAPLAERVIAEQSPLLTQFCMIVFGSCAWMAWSIEMLA